jgi:Ni,Fe-hydrogenase III large subunit
MSYTLAIGPFTPFWRGPQRLVLQVADEVVTDVTYYGGYNERSCAERLPRLRAEQALHLVARICGSSSHAHTLAFCEAIEALTSTDVPDQALFLRCAVAEVERLASHLEALRAIFDLLGMQPQTTTIRDMARQARAAMKLLSGRPALPDICMPGGVRRPLGRIDREELRPLMNDMSEQLFAFIDRTIDARTLLRRTVDIGTLARDVVEQFALRGPVARAAGVGRDSRLDAPYAAYSALTVRPVVQEGGDVHARMVVLLLEAFESLKLADQALEALPGGDWEGSMTLLHELPSGQASAAVESPRGLLRYTVEGDGQRLSQVVIDAPRQIDRLLARTLFVGAQVDNVALIALSMDACAACAEG